MDNLCVKPRTALNKAYLKVKPERRQVDNLKANLEALLSRVSPDESEEFNKNLLSRFLLDTWYNPEYFINTKGRNDLVIHNGPDASSSVGVIIETKRPGNRTEMISKENLNAKALQELLWYFLGERITEKNSEVKHLVVTNVEEWFVFDARLFDKLFAQDKALVRKFEAFRDKQLSDTSTEFFYREIAAPVIEANLDKLTHTHFFMADYVEAMKKHGDDSKLIPLLKILSPEHLLKLPFVNDSNTLDKRFYSELLHIIGLSETKQKGKKLIERKKDGHRDPGSLLENAINQLDSLDKVNRMDNAGMFGVTYQERLFNVGLELCITWINRILFLKLLEAQVVRYHKNDKRYSFLNIEQVPRFGDLNALFFSVLARKPEERNEYVREDFAHVPYLNSSLFEVSEIEDKTIVISNLLNERTIRFHPQTVLKDEAGKRKKGTMNALEYLFAFLNAYDFSSEGTEEVQEENKTLINASVLGLIFEKINGYKDGSFFTPGFITMYMCRETIRRALLQKFREEKGWDYDNFTDLHNKIEPSDIRDANNIVNDLKICDPAVGSGHFLVSALNEIIAIKHELKILCDRQGRRLKEYDIEVVNDELVITYQNELFEYRPGSRESQRVQEALFHEKQTIIENCLFGVDINPNSVKICRLRLWIELLKHAYYNDENQLETLPNIDINIKCGNSLVSRFTLDADLGQALKKSKWSIETYQTAVQAYRRAHDKEEKREMIRLISDIKNDFRTEIRANDPKVLRLAKLKGELFNLTNQTKLFDPSKKEQDAWDQKLGKLTKEITKLEKEVEEIKSNRIYDNAFEWRFEFPEVLNDQGEYVGFDVIIGNPPYLQLSKTEGVTKEHKAYMLEAYETSGGRLNTFIFFTHLSNKVLHPNGFLHFIVPNTILSQDYYVFTRGFLVNKVSLSEIVTFPVLPFEDAVVETVLIQYTNRPNLVKNIEIKELSKDNIRFVSKFKTETIIKDPKFSFVYQEDQIIEKVYEREYSKFGAICEINQGIAIKGDKSLTLKSSKINDNCYKLLDGRNIHKYSVKWNGVWIDYDLNKIHSCKRKDIFESPEKLMFRRVSSSLIFAYDNEQFYALNTLVIVNKKDLDTGPDLKFILGLMNSRLMNYVYTNKFKSTKTVFSEIQARSVQELPIPKTSKIKELEIATLADKIICLKKRNSDTAEPENEINKLVYEIYELTEHEIKIIESA